MAKNVARSIRPSTASHQSLAPTVARPAQSTSCHRCLLKRGGVRSSGAARVCRSKGARLDSHAMPSRSVSRRLGLLGSARSTDLRLSLEEKSEQLYWSRPLRLRPAELGGGATATDVGVGDTRVGPGGATTTASGRYARGPGAAPRGRLAAQARLEPASAVAKAAHRRTDQCWSRPVHPACRVLAQCSAPLVNVGVFVDFRQNASPVLVCDAHRQLRWIRKLARGRLAHRLAEHGLYVSKTEHELWDCPGAHCVSAVWRRPAQHRPRTSRCSRGKQPTTSEPHLVPPSVPLRAEDGIRTLIPFWGRGF